MYLLSYKADLLDLDALPVLQMCGRLICIKEHRYCSHLSVSQTYTSLSFPRRSYEPKSTLHRSFVDESLLLPQLVHVRQLRHTILYASVTSESWRPQGLVDVAFVLRIGLRPIFPLVSWSTLEETSCMFSCVLWPIKLSHVIIKPPLTCFLIYLTLPCLVLLLFGIYLCTQIQRRGPQLRKAMHLPDRARSFFCPNERKHRASIRMIDICQHLCLLSLSPS
ncbi:hypothetical protein K474DRAFT_762097 [Panus rudis PR-1116 ss-1]|nr:hypothetical protein K474DRAFT_762097 [Panus rudis PR-1116 ss-1]